MSSLSRREILHLAAGAGAWVTLAGCRSSESDDAAIDETVPQSTTETAAASTSGQPSEGEYGPSEGDLTLALWAAPATATIVSGLSSDVYSFGAEVVAGDPGAIEPSGSYLGPTLHFRQGQRVRVSFENRMPDESIVHWHGLTVPQDQDGQPPEAVGQGEIYEYDFTVDDEPGTYWYHPHPHGKTAEQVYRGLAGLIIVHGDEPALPTGANDLSLVLQDRTVGADGTLQYVSSMHDQMAGFVGSTLVTNGVAEFTVEVQPQPYRLRLLNGANSRTQRLSFSTGESMTAIATDGSLLTEPVTVPGLVLTPAQRTDLWVDFSVYEPGTRVELLTQDLFVESSAMMMGSGQGQGAGEGAGGFAAQLDETLSVAAVFTVGVGAVITGTLPAVLGDEPGFGAGDAVNADSPKVFELSTFRMAHWIDGRQWEGRTASELETVGAGTVELWEFVNRSPMPHPMHLHGRSFRVTARSWDDNSLADLWSSIESGVVESGRRDTVLVWPGQRVQIAVPFSELTGHFLYHCHILEHEDTGMMRNFHAI